MSSDQPNPNKPPKPVNSPLVGAIVGGFIGLVLDKFALGLIFGFLAGLLIGAHQRKTTAATPQRPAESKPKNEAE